MYVKNYYKIILIITITAFGALSFGFPFDALKAKTPAITTNPASLVSGDSIQLNGFLDPSELIPPTTYLFEWGRTNSLGNFTYPETIHTTFPRYISKEINLPDISATYYFRTVVQNGQGAQYGKILTFKMPREQITPGPASSAAPMGGQIINSQSPPLETIPALSPVTIKQKVANISFPNGTESVTSGKAGDIFEFILSIENISNKTLHNLTIKDKLSIFLEFTEGSPNYQYNQPQNEVFWELAKLPSKAKLSFNIKVKGKKFSDNLVLENRAMAGNTDFSTDSEKTSILLNNPALSTTFKTRNEKVFPDGISEYEIYYKNESDALLKNVMLQIFFPNEINFQESAEKFYRENDILTLIIGEIKPDQGGLINFNAAVSKPANNEKNLTTLMIISYQRNLAEEKEIVSAVVQNIIDKRLVNLSARASAEPINIVSILLLIVIPISLILAILCLYYYGLYKKAEAKIILCEEKARNLKLDLEANAAREKLQETPLLEESE